MKIKIDDIGEGGLDINADSEKNPWLKAIFNELYGGERFIEGDFGRLNLQAFRQEKNVTLLGGVILKYHPTCDRCLCNFQKQVQVPVHMILIPAYIKDGKRAENNTDDEDFGYYEGDEIDIDAVVREQMLLMQQMVNRCKDDCKGLCPTCGKNLNDGPCKCKKKEEHNSPFAILKKKVVKKSRT